MRIASKAADRIEDQIDGANITQATIAFGVATEKALLLAGKPLQRLELNVMAQPHDLYAEMRAITAQITEALRLPPSPRPLMPSFSYPLPLLEIESPEMGSATPLPRSKPPAKFIAWSSP